MVRGPMLAGHGRFRGYGCSARWQMGRCGDGARPDAGRPRALPRLRAVADGEVRWWCAVPCWWPWALPRLRIISTDRRWRGAVMVRGPMLAGHGRFRGCGLFRPVADGKVR
jgi:hypothetical protein